MGNFENIEVDPNKELIKKEGAKYFEEILKRLEDSETPVGYNREELKSELEAKKKQIIEGNYFDKIEFTLEKEGGTVEREVKSVYESLSSDLLMSKVVADSMDRNEETKNKFAQGAFKLKRILDAIEKTPEFSEFTKKENQES